MLSGLILENFKAFGGRHVIPFAPITLIFGANSAGKSSIIQAILMLKQTVDRKRPSSSFFKLNGDIIRLGLYDDIVFRPRRDRYVGDTNCEIAPLVMRFEEKPRYEKYGDSETLTTLSLPRISPITHGIGFHAHSYRRECELGSFRVYRGEIGSFDQADLSLHRSSDREYRRLARDMDEDSSERRSGLVYDGVSLMTLRDAELVTGRSYIHLDYVLKHRDGVNTWGEVSTVSIDTAVHHIYKSVRKELSRIEHVGPVRETLARIIRVGSDDDGHHDRTLEDEIIRNRATRSELNDACDRFHIGYHFEVLENSEIEFGEMYSIRLIEDGTDISVPPDHVGSGVSQVVPVIVETIMARNKIVIVQQPELHLHPRLQAELGSLFAESYIDRDNQLIIETHSEHLILRIQRLVENGYLQPEDVAVLYVERDEEGSHCYPIPLDEDGEFTQPWPGGFFEEGYNERFGKTPLPEGQIGDAR